MEEEEEYDYEVEEDDVEEEDRSQETFHKSHVVWKCKENAIQPGDHLD